MRMDVHALLHAIILSGVHRDPKECLERKRAHYYLLHFPLHVSSDCSIVIVGRQICVVHPVIVLEICVKNLIYLIQKRATLRLAVEHSIVQLSKTCRKNLVVANIRQSVVPDLSYRCAELVCQRLFHGEGDDRPVLYSMHGESAVIVVVVHHKFPTVQKWPRILNRDSLFGQSLQRPALLVRIERRVLSTQLEIGQRHVWVNVVQVHARACDRSMKRNDDDFHVAAKCRNASSLRQEATMC